MILRLITSAVLLFSVLFMPFWVSVILALVGIIYFKFFIEAVGLLLLSDLLYGAREEKMGYMIGVSFIVSLLFFVILEILKSRLRLRS